MITTEEALKLRRLIRERVRSNEDEQFAGSEPPEIAEAIRRDAKEARLALYEFIRSITAPTVS